VIETDDGSRIIPYEEGWLFVEGRPVRREGVEGIGEVLVPGLLASVAYDVRAYAESIAGFAEGRGVLLPPAGLQISLDALPAYTIRLVPPRSEGRAFARSDSGLVRNYAVKASGVVAMKLRDLRDGTWSFYAYGDGWDIARPITFTVSEGRARGPTEAPTREAAGLRCIVPKGEELAWHAFVVREGQPRKLPAMPTLGDPLRAAKVASGIEIRGIVDVPALLVLYNHRERYAVSVSARSDSGSIAIQSPRRRKGIIDPAILQKLKVEAGQGGRIVLEQRM
jgi:hypothetical protein